LGLTAESLVQVEDFAEALRNDAKTTRSIKKQTQYTNESALDAQPSKLEHFDKLVVELERCHIDLDDLHTRVFETEVIDFKYRINF
jgi:hypothetical protein